METLSKVFNFAKYGGFDQLLTIAMGLLLVVILLAPTLEKRLAPWKGSRSQIEATGEVIRCIAGVVILVALVAWAIWGR